MMMMMNDLMKMMMMMHDLMMMMMILKKMVQMMICLILDVFFQPKYEFFLLNVGVRWVGKNVVLRRKPSLRL